MPYSHRVNRSRIVIAVASTLALLVLSRFAVADSPPAMPDMPGMSHGMTKPAADSLQGRYDFFSNYGNYLPRIHCIQNADGTPDWPWIGVLLALNVAIIVGYLKIFRFWRQCYVAERPDDRHTKLMDLAFIFLLCATCGYGFFIVTLFWPGYRLLALFMLALSVVTWRFAFDLDSFRLSFSAKRLQRELNEHLQRRNDELAQLVDDRTRELERVNGFKRAFLSNMSHELRTPMTAILGFADIMSDDSLERVERDDALETIQRNGRHLLGLLNDVLDMSKIEAGKLSVERVPCDVDEVAGEVVRLLAGRAQERGITLDVSHRSAVPAVIHTDPMRLRQILTNLAANAIKFTTNGQVTLELSFDPSSDEKTGQMRFAVIDTGCGIAANALERVFEPFEQVDRAASGGTGLGLTISRNLAHLLGGNISATSVVGKGSVFTLVIDAGEITMHRESPVVPIVAAPPSPSTPPANGKSLLGRRILVAEDAPDAQLLLKHLLKSWGAEPTIVETGIAVLEQVATAIEKPFDVVLMDMQMPAMDGLVATRQLRLRGSDLPIIMLTANAMAGDRERCMAAGCTDYSAKPVDPALLLEKITAALCSNVV